MNHLVFDEQVVSTPGNALDELETLLSVVRSVSDRLVKSQWDSDMPLEIRNHLYGDGLSLALFAERAEGLICEGRKLSAMNSNNTTTAKRTVMLAKNAQMGWMEATVLETPRGGV